MIFFAYFFQVINILGKKCDLKILTMLHAIGRDDVKIEATAEGRIQFAEKYQALIPWLPLQ